MASPKICKSCRNIIPAGSKYCPVCGAKAPQGLPTWAIVVICLVGVIFLIGVFNSDKPEKVESTPSIRASSEPTVKATSTPKPTPTPEPVFTIGDTAEMQDVRVTLHDVRISYGESFLNPASGYVFLIFDIEIENNRENEITISSLLCFDAYADDYALELSLSGMTTDSGKQMDGEIAPGKKMRGVVAFEAPEDWQKAELRFKPSVWSGKAFVFTASSSDSN
jgi:hypothetical protein